MNRVKYAQYGAIVDWSPDCPLNPNKNKSLVDKQMTSRSRLFNVDLSSHFNYTLFRLFGHKMT